MRQSSLIDSFLAHARRQPGAPALAWRQERISYGELYQLASRARSLIDRRAPEGAEPIGIPAAKSPRAIALVLACLLAGRRFLLAPPTLPPAVLARLFERAGCRVVLAPNRIETEPVGHASPPAGGPEEVSFILTTSGSTGEPKIVPLTAGAVDRFTDWASDRFGIRPGTTVLNYAPLNFDLCLLDIWTTLKHGGRVVLVDPDRSTNAGYLLDLLDQHDVQVVQAVPMFYRLLLDATRETGTRLDTVEHVIFTGDSMPGRCLAELPRLFGKARMYNVYGCTETNDSFIHEIDTSAPPRSPVPLGRPLPGTLAVIVRVDGTVLNGQGVGELYVSTPFQADGYLDQPGSDKFVPDPQGRDDRRYFRSGDLVRRHAEGSITLEGRSDFHVKVAGVQINTQEVEQVMAEHRDVVEAAVVTVPDPLAGHRLHSVVRKQEGSQLNTLALRQHCADRLSRNAIPSVIRIVDEPLPRTSTGKVDRNLVELACAAGLAGEHLPNNETGQE